MAAVDARGPKDQTTESNPVVVRAERERRDALFARERTPEPEPASDDSDGEKSAAKPAESQRAGGNATPEQKQE